MIAKKARRLICVLFAVNIPYFLFVAVNTFFYEYAFLEGWAYCTNDNMATAGILNILCSCISLILAVLITKDLRVAAHGENDANPERRYFVYNPLLIAVWTVACFSILPCFFILLIFF
jgi:hypothetical protein